MTDQIERFEGRYTPLTPEQQLENAWDAAAGKTLVDHAGWLFGDPVPIEVIESWAAFMRMLREASEIDDPHDVDWPVWWVMFVDAHLATTPIFKNAVAAAVGEPRHVRLPIFSEGPDRARASESGAAGA